MFKQKTIQCEIHVVAGMHGDSSISTLHLAGGLHVNAGGWGDVYTLCRLRIPCQTSPRNRRTSPCGLVYVAILYKSQLMIKYSKCYMQDL